MHHAQNDVYLDRNYGGLFIIWDRLFGTFQEELDGEPVVFGIRGALKSFNPFRALTHIYVDMAQDSWRTRDWRDKLRVWVSRTGWRPADVAARYPREKTDLSNFHRFDPQVPGVVSGYAFFQLVALVTLLVTMLAIEPGYWSGVALWAFLLGTSVATALWLDGRAASSLLPWEALRLVLAACFLALNGPALFGAMGVGVAWGYCGVNLLFLALLNRGAARAGALASP